MATADAKCTVTRERSESRRYLSGRHFLTSNEWHLLVSPTLFMGNIDECALAPNLWRFAINRATEHSSWVPCSSYRSMLRVCRLSFSHLSLSTGPHRVHSKWSKSQIPLSQIPLTTSKRLKVWIVIKLYKYYFSIIISKLKFIVSVFIFLYFVTEEVEEAYVFNSEARFNKIISSAYVNPLIPCLGSLIRSYESIQKAESLKGMLKTMSPCLAADDFIKASWQINWYECLSMGRGMKRLIMSVIGV